MIILDLRTWSADLSGHLDPEGLRALLDEVAGGAFGAVDTLNGIARVGTGWARFRIEDGRASFSDLEADLDTAPEARVVAVGTALDGARLRQAFEGCASRA